MNTLNSILILFVAFVAVFLETTFDGVRHLFGAQIEVLPALMIYASLSSGLTTVTALAVCGGMCFDSLSANPLGISILPLFLPGYLIYLRRGLILRDQYYAQMVLGLLASAIVPLLALLLLLKHAACAHAELALFMAMARHEHRRRAADPGDFQAVRRVESCVELPARRGNQFPEGP